MQTSINSVFDPDWVAMKDLPEYAETVSAAVETYLEPADFSQI